MNDDIERFWRGVDRRGPNECWPYIGAQQTPWEGRNQTKRRVAWTIKNRPLRVGEMVLSKCPNAACCNPAHSFVGTKKKRGELMARNKRSTFGERNPHAKLTEDDVRTIRHMRDSGKLYREIRERYDYVSYASLVYICLRKSWAHVE